MRSLVRWLRRLVLVALALALLVLGAALTTAHTRWGREQLRSRLEAALADAYPGGARVGSLDGSVLGALTLHDVELGLIAANGVRGGPGVRITAGTLRGELALWPLLVKTARIDHLAAEDVHVIVREPPPAGPARRAASPWRLELADLAVRGATLEIELARLALRDVDATGTLRLDAGGLAISGTAHGRRICAGGVTVTADLAAAIAPAADAPGVMQLAITAARGDARVSATARVEPARRAARVMLSAVAVDLDLVSAGRIRGHGNLLAAFEAGQGSAWGALIAHGDIAGPGVPVRRAGVAIAGSLDHAAAVVLATGDEALQTAAKLSLRVTGHAGSGLAVWIAGDATATSVASSDIAIASAKGSYGLALAPELRLDRAELTAKGIRRDGRALGDAHVELARSGPGPSGGATYDVAATVWPALGGAGGGGAAIDGVVVAARARVRELGAAYHAELSSVRVVRGGSAWSGRGGTLIVAYPTEAARTEIAARGVVLRRGDAALGLRGRYVAATGALDAHVTGERLDVSALDARARGSGRGALDLGHHGGQWTAAATLALDDLTVAPGTAPADVTATVSLVGQQLRLAAHAGASPGGLDLVFGATAPRDPLDLAAWRRLDRGAIHTAAITARQVALPGLVGVAGLVAPTGAIGETIIQTIGGAIGGTIDGTVELAPAHVAGAFTVRGVVTPLGALDGDVRLADRDGDVEVAAAARLPGIAAADLTARIALPRYPLDLASWQDHRRDLLRRLTARLDSAALDAPLVARLGLDRRLAASGAARWLAARGLALPDHARARAALELGGAGGDAELTIDLDDVAGGALRAPMSLRLAARAGAAGTRVRGELAGRGLGLGVGVGVGLGVIDGDLAMTADRWLAAPAEALAAPLAARWTLPAVSAATVLALFGRRDVQSGTLAGSAMICGSLAAPVVPATPARVPARPAPVVPAAPAVAPTYPAPCGDASVVPTRLVARDLVFARRPGARQVPAVQELALAATWDGGAGHLTLDGRQATGELHLSVTGRPGAIGEATGQVALRRFDVASIATFLPGWPGSASGTVDGTLALRRGNQLAGDLVITGGALSFPGAIAKIGALRDARARLSTQGGAVSVELDGQLARGRVHLEAAAPVDLATVEIRTLHLDRVSPIVAPRPIITADLSARLHRGADRWRGDVRIQRGSVTLTGRTGTQLLDAALPDDLKLTNAPPDAVEQAPPAAPAPRLLLEVAPARVHLDAQVHIARELVTALELTGALHNPAPLTVAIGETVRVGGRVEITGADLRVFGRPYQLEDTTDGPSGLVFENALDPLLRARMSHRFAQLVLHVDVRSHLAKFERPAFSSDTGAYTDNQLFGLFVGGEPGDAPSAQGAVAGLATRWFTGQFGNQLSKFLPIRLETSCDTDPATTTTIGSCAVGTRIRDRLFLSYRARLQPHPDDENSRVDVQLQLRDGLLLEGTGGDRGHFGADLLLGHRW